MTSLAPKSYLDIAKESMKIKFISFSETLEILKTPEKKSPGSRIDQDFTLQEKNILKKYINGKNINLALDLGFDLEELISFKPYLYFDLQEQYRKEKITELALKRFVSFLKEKDGEEYMKDFVFFKISKLNLIDEINLLEIAKNVVECVKIFQQNPKVVKICSYNYENCPLILKFASQLNYKFCKLEGKILQSFRNCIIDIFYKIALNDNSFEYQKIKSYRSDLIREKCVSFFNQPSYGCFFHSISRNLLADFCYFFPYIGDLILDCENKNHNFPFQIDSLNEEEFHSLCRGDGRYYLKSNGDHLLNPQTKRFCHGCGKYTYCFNVPNDNFNQRIAVCRDCL